MDRRLIGALLVVIVLSAAMTVPVLSGLRTPGAAIAAEPHDPPRLGDCLRERPAALNVAPIGLRATASVDSESPRAPVLGPLGPTVVSCAGGSVAGEVIRMVSADGNPADLEGAVAESGINCRLSALAYAGLTSAGSSAEATLPVGMPIGGAAGSPVTWKMTVNVRTTWVYPSALQRASGHRWAACVAAPPDNVSYSGSLAGALHRRPAARRFRHVLGPTMRQRRRRLCPLRPAALGPNCSSTGIVPDKQVRLPTRGSPSAPGSAGRHWLSGG